MTFLNYEALAATPVRHDPYHYIVVPDFVREAAMAGINSSFPSVPGPGSHPLPGLNVAGDFSGLIEELKGARFQGLIESKFEVDLSDRPTMFTVRGFCRATDGKIHTDSKTKIITVLLYLNDKWDTDGGRLRILRSGTDLEDFVDEVPPHGGTLLVFRRSDNSWHGHESFEGKRRAIQMNWVADKNVVSREQGRHRLSATVKRLNPFARAH